MKKHIFLESHRTSFRVFFKCKYCGDFLHTPLDKYEKAIEILKNMLYDMAECKYGVEDNKFERYGTRTEYLYQRFDCFMEVDIKKDIIHVKKVKEELL